MTNPKEWLIFDAHLDLAMNAMEWNRDLTQSVAALRARETGLTDKPDRGHCTVSLPEMRKGRVGLCVATQIARFVKKSNPLPGWHSPQQAWAMTQAQLAWYKTMEDLGQMTPVTDRASLEAHLARWAAPQDGAPIGYILSLEGADSIINPDYLEKAYESGLRALGPAHYGPGTYAQGTDATGGMIAGNARHVGIGSDLDGAFGTEQCPADLDTIAGLQKLPAVLQKRGYAEADIEGVMSGNCIRFLKKAWKA